MNSEASASGTLTRPFESASQRGNVVRNVVILACAVDAADRALLPATFKALSAEMGADPTDLGMISLAQTLAFAISLPVWSALMGRYSSRTLMTVGCASFGLLTVVLAFFTLYPVQLVVRIFMGFALGSVNPIGQSVLCEVVPKAERGLAFGILTSVSAGLLIMSSAFTTMVGMETVFGMHGWRICYLVTALLALLAAAAIHRTLPDNTPIPPPQGSTWLSERRKVLASVIKKPSLVIIIIQGLFGSVPWSAMSFLIFYLQLSGFTDTEAGVILLWGGLAAFIGGVLGGHIGDLFAKWRPLWGRITVAQFGIVTSAFCASWMLSIPHSADSSSLHHVIIANIFFSLVAHWAQPAALRPMTGELFTDSEERAQVFSLWVGVETVFAALLGAPLVALLSEEFGYRLETNKAGDFIGDRLEGVEAMRKALLGTTVPFWLVCALLWTPMYWTFPQDRPHFQQNGSKKTSVNDRSPLREDANNLEYGH